MNIYDYDVIKTLLQSLTVHLRLEEISSSAEKECQLSNASNCVGKFIFWWISGSLSLALRVLPPVRMLNH